jgi:hypothetical protein
MTIFTVSLKLLKGGIVLIDLESSAVQWLITLHYNPDTLTRTQRGRPLHGGLDK